MNVLAIVFCSFLSHPVLVVSLAAKKAPASKIGGGFGPSKEIDFLHKADTSESTQNLLQFLRSQNAKGLDDVEIGIHETTGVRGLFAMKNFKANQILCQIPSDCALALSDPSKNEEDAPTLAHGGANFLSNYWQDEDARRMWAPYLDTLPTMGSPQFDPTPDFFGDEELELLEFPRLMNLAKERKAQVALVAAERGLDFDELQFATWLAASRAFRISIATQDDYDPKYDDKGQIMAKAGEQKAIRVMVPFIDMANHSSDQPNARLTLIDPEKDDAWFALEASRPIAGGKEIVIAYGNGVESSVELFMNYGFIPKTNKIDKRMLGKGGNDCITSAEEWTTSLEEDYSMLSMTGDDATLRKILSFRIKLKEAYSA